MPHYCMRSFPECFHHPAVRVVMEEEDAIVRPTYPPHFPQELLEMIFDYLFDDKLSLRRCSLVCKAWVSVASSDLFRQLWWPPCRYHWEIMEHPDESCRVQCCKCHEQGIDTFAACAQALSFSSRIRIATQELALSSRRYPHSAYNIEPLSLKALESILCLLPRLQSLNLCHTPVQVDSLPETSKRGRYTLHTLQVDIDSYHPCQDVNALHNTLALFQSVTRLDVLSSVLSSFLRGRGIEQDDTLPLLPDSGLAQAVAVRSVHLSRDVDMHSQMYLCRAFQARIDLSTLVSLEVEGDMCGDLVFLAQAATNLQSLDYQIRTERAESNLFSPVPQLRMLRIHASVYISRSSPFGGHWKCMTAHVERMAAPSTMQLNLRLRFGPFNRHRLEDLEKWLKAMDWALFEKALRGYEALESLRIEIDRQDTCWLGYSIPDAVAVIRDVAEARLSSKVSRLLEVVLS